VKSMVQMDIQWLTYRSIHVPAHVVRWEYHHSLSHTTHDPSSNNHIISLHPVMIKLRSMHDELPARIMFLAIVMGFN
jgi:hypothetical protein